MTAIIIVAIVIAFFSTAYAAPKEFQESEQQLLKTAAKIQVYKTTKLALLDFAINVLSTISKNFESIKNGGDDYKELDIQQLFWRFFSTFMSAVRKDAIDPNDELLQTFFNVFNSIISAAAKETQHGKAQLSQTGKFEQRDVFAKYSGATD